MFHLSYFFDFFFLYFQPTKIIYKLLLMEITEKKKYLQELHNA